jgi:hypothetical protein
MWLIDSLRFMPAGCNPRRRALAPHRRREGAQDQRRVIAFKLTPAPAPAPMPLSARRALPLLVIAQSACLVPNWLYEDDATETTSALTATADATATTAEETSTSSGGVTGTADSDTNDTTGEPASCWSRPPDSWDSITQILDLGLGADPSAARISPDGLDLVYIAAHAGLRRPFIASRPARDQPFTVGALLSDLPGLKGLGVDYPTYRVDLEGRRELLLSVSYPGDLMITHDDNFGDLVAPLTNLNTIYEDTYPTLTADGSRLIFVRRDGPLNPHLNDDPVFQFYEAKRGADAPAGAAFTSGVLVQIPFNDPPLQLGYPHFSPCAALSPDGLRFFFGSSYPVVLDSVDKQIDALDIFATDRGSIDATDWSPAVELHLFHEVGWETCPNAITADGCELLFHRFVFGAGAYPGQDTYKLYLARRAP